MIAVFGANGGLGSAIAEHLTGVFGSVERVVRRDADIRDEEGVSRLFWRLASSYPDGRPWHIINATGTCMNGTLESGSYLDFIFDLKNNLGGSALILKGMSRYLEARPHSSVTLLSSVVAPMGVYGAYSYGAAKSGLNGLMRSACKEFAKYRCRVNVIELGYFNVGMIEKVPAKIQSKLVSEIPLLRFGEPDEAAIACEFSIRCGYLNGAVVPVNGGVL